MVIGNGRSLERLTSHCAQRKWMGLSQEVSRAFQNLFLDVSVCGRVEWAFESDRKLRFFYAVDGVA